MSYARKKIYMKSECLTTCPGQNLEKKLSIYIQWAVGPQCKLRHKELSTKE